MAKAYKTIDGNYAIFISSKSNAIRVKPNQVSAALKLAKSIPAGTHNRNKIVTALINQVIKK